MKPSPAVTMVHNIVPSRDHSRASLRQKSRTPLLNLIEPSRRARLDGTDSGQDQVRAVVGVVVEVDVVPTFVVPRFHHFHRGRFEWRGQ